MRHALGLELVVPADLDTDVLGTFTGEVAREGTPQQVCLRKARLGMAAAGLPLGLANEGSFGPDPLLPFVQADTEVMTFVDDERGLIVTEQLVTHDTNHAQREACGIDDLARWLDGVRFPSHALVVLPKAPGATAPADKGIVSLDHLEQAIRRAAHASPEGVAWVRTDMRAHLNPLRMSAIRRLAFRLARRLATACPACAAPGWGLVGTVEGLPCETCAAATRMVRAEVLGCVACPHREQTARRDGRHLASAGSCDYCNP